MFVDFPQNIEAEKFKEMREKQRKARKHYDK